MDFLLLGVPRSRSSRETPCHPSGTTRGPGLHLFPRTAVVSVWGQVVGILSSYQPLLSHLPTAWASSLLSCVTEAQESSHGGFFHLGGWVEDPSLEAGTSGQKRMEEAARTGRTTLMDIVSFWTRSAPSPDSREGRI